MEGTYGNQWREISGQQPRTKCDPPVNSSKELNPAVNHISDLGSKSSLSQDLDETAALAYTLITDM